jgi:alpha/beta superfamily hydrolase
MDVAQTSFFFEHEARQLLGVYFPVEGSAEKVAVLCNGYAGEHVICRPHLAHCGRQLVARGVPALRFDYTGYGDSEGEFVEATPERMTLDIEGAIAEAKRRSGASRVVLIGVRFGATLAAQVAGVRDDVSDLVLWEPLPDLWKYVFAELRQTVAMQTLLFRDVRVNRDTIVDNVLAERPSLVDGYDMNCIDDGYRLGKGFIEGVKTVNLLERPPTLAARTLILHLRERPGKPGRPLVQLAEQLGGATRDGATIELETVVQQTTMWKHGRFYMTHSPQVVARTLDWLEGKPRSEGDTEAARPAAGDQAGS